MKTIEDYLAKERDELVKIAAFCGTWRNQLNQLLEAVRPRDIWFHVVMGNVVVHLAFLGDEDRAEALRDRFSAVASFAEAVGNNIVRKGEERDTEWDWVVEVEGGEFVFDDIEPREARTLRFTPRLTNEGSTPYPRDYADELERQMGRLSKKGGAS